MREEERKLIEEVLAGDSAAWERLMQPYVSRIFRTVYRLLGNQADATHVVQATVTKAHQTLDTFKGDQHFFTWLYRIAMNQAIDFKRKQKRLLPPI